MSEEVVFWKWINAHTIALVTGTAVYHWKYETDSTPKHVFARLESMAETNIVSYRCDANEKWSLLVGFVARDFRVHGAMQLYSAERDVSRCTC